MEEKVVLEDELELTLQAEKNCAHSHYLTIIGTVKTVNHYPSKNFSSITVYCEEPDIQKKRHHKTEGFYICFYHSFTYWKALQQSLHSLNPYDDVKIICKQNSYTDKITGKQTKYWFCSKLWVLKHSKYIKRTNKEKKADLLTKQDKVYDFEKDLDI